MSNGNAFDTSLHFEKQLHLNYPQTSHLAQAQKYLSMSDETVDFKTTNTEIGCNKL